MAKSAKRHITISEEMGAWLDAHGEINLSGLVERWLRNYAKAYEGRVET